jgi:hypothetical protein
MSRLTMMLKGQPFYTMSSKNPITDMLGGSLNSVTNQRDLNHIVTNQQVNAYAFNKEMLTREKGDMRGNISGYGETLG